MCPGLNMKLRSMKLSLYSWDRAFLIGTFFQSHVQLREITSIYVKNKFSAVQICSESCPLHFQKRLTRIPYSFISETKFLAVCSWSAVNARKLKTLIISLQFNLLPIHYENWGKSETKLYRWDILIVCQIPFKALASNYAAIVAK